MLIIYLQLISCSVSRRTLSRLRFLIRDYGFCTSSSPAKFFPEYESAAEALFKMSSTVLNEWHKFLSTREDPLLWRYIYHEILVLRGRKRNPLLNFRAATARSESSPTKTPSCVLVTRQVSGNDNLRHPEVDWTYDFCALPKLDDSFFVDKSIADILSATCTGSEEINTTSSSTTSSELPTVW